MKIAVLDINGVQSTRQGKLEYYYAVADNYDFNGNSATDVTDVTNLKLFNDVLRLDYYTYRESLVSYADTVTFSGLTNSDKKILVKNLAVNKIDRDSVYTTQEQEEFAIDIQGKINVSNTETMFSGNSTNIVSEVGVPEITVNLTGKTYYDVVVDASGGGDFLLPSAAFAAGHKVVFVRFGTYYETADIVIPNQGMLLGESGAEIDFTGASLNVVVDGNGGAKYTTGTFSVTNGSTTVTGSGTLFLANVSVGDFIGIGPDFYKIASVTNNTVLVLENPWNGPNRSGLPVFITKMFADVTIEGLIIKNSSDSNGALFLRGIQAAYINNLDIHSSSLNYNINDSANIVTTNLRSSSSIGNGLQVNSSRSLTFSDSHFFGNGGWGVNLVGGLAHKLSNCEFSSNVSGGANITGNVSDVTFNGCGSKQNLGKGFNTDTGTIRCIITDGTIQFNGGVGVDFDGSQNIVSNCQIGNNGSDGMYCGDLGVVSNNHIHNNSGIGVNLNGDNQTIISNNSIANNGSDGVNFNGTNNDVTLEGNTLIGNGGWGINIDVNALRARLSDNTFISNTSGTINDLSTTTIYSYTNESAQFTRLTEKGTPVNGDWLIIEDSAASNVKKKVQVGNLPSGGGGESNTASNVGVGDGLFKQKNGVDLEFISLSAGTNVTFTTGDTLVINATGGGGGDFANGGEAGGANRTLGNTDAFSLGLLTNNVNRFSIAANGDTVSSGSGHTFGNTTDNISTLVSIRSKEDAKLWIQGDSDNVSEDDNPEIILQQDGNTGTPSLGRFFMGTNTFGYSNDLVISTGRKTDTPDNLADIVFVVDQTYTLNTDAPPTFDNGSGIAAIRIDNPTGLVTVNKNLALTNPAGTFAYTITPSAIGADRTLTIPLLTGNDTFVTQAFAQTLTNKTINSTNNTISSTSQAVGDLLKNNGSKYVRFGKGSALQVLRVNAGGTDLEWAAPSGGGETNTASNIGGGTGIFKQKAGVDLEFKSLSSSTGNIVIEGQTSTVDLRLNNDITLNSLSATTLSGGSGYFDTHIDFNNNVNPKPSYKEGRFFYDYNEHTIAVYNDEADVTHQLGQEGYVRVYNSSGSLIPNGSIVYITGVEGTEDRPTVGLANASASTKDDAIGVVTHSLENNTFGYVTTWGLVSDLDTSSYTAGDTVYLSETVNGGLQNTKPSSASTCVEVGTVVKANATTGRILVHMSTQGAVGPQGPPGVSALSIIPSVQVRNSASVSLGGTLTDITFDTTDIETDTTIIEHNNTNTDRIDIKQDGNYLIYYDGRVQDATFRVRINDSTVIPSSTQTHTASAGDRLTLSKSFQANLSDGDYITFQASGNNDIFDGATFGVILLKGVKGDAGPAGADGDITWEGTWDSGSGYTTNQAVQYQGSSYVSIQDGTNQTPTTSGTSYWDVLALKGDKGDDGVSTPVVTEASATGTITRTSSTYGLATSMTLTPASGTYMVWFSSTISNGQNGGETTIALYGGGTILQHTERNMSNQSNAVTGTHFPVATNGLVTVNGSQAIEVRWKQVGGGTGSMYERTLNIMKVT